MTTIGAVEAKLLFWLPAFLGATAAVPGGDVDPASILMRFTILGCVLGGYVEAVLRGMARRTKPPLVERVMDGFATWSVNAITGGVMTYVVFHVTTIPISAGSVLGVAFAGGMGGSLLAGTVLRVLKAREKQIAEGIGRVLKLPAGGGDSDPQT